MLTLQRASAGSGKTYTLTKKFIRLLITIKDEGASQPRLRTDAELRDAVSHILAVTFTNKATDEMKKRIMVKLNDLAFHVDPAHPEKTDYLSDFCKELGVKPEEISYACRIALRQLLYSFSDFNVMTIDSFFQAILRTFAYEAELPDGYELIIDTGYITRQVVLNMIEDLSVGRLSKATERWVRYFVSQAIEKGERKWNIFTREEAKGVKSGALFNQFRDIAGDLDHEANKKARKQLTEYFDKGGNLEEVFDEVWEYFDGRLCESFGKLSSAAHDVIDAASQLTDAPMAEYIYKGNFTPGQLYRLTARNANPDEDYKIPNTKDAEWTTSNILSSKVKAAQKRAWSVEAQPLADAMNQLRAAYDEWSAVRNGAQYQIWKRIRSAFPRVGLMHDLLVRTEQFLLETGTMKLSDTNTMLRRIISDDDVPFIYERYGSRFRHFLIDEFQDTSRLQWENFLPLLRESESHDHENLIIGDAKQSIYRFRSADPTLITEKVPAEFPRLDPRGYSIDENANWRSSRRIVKFNNFFFRSLTQTLGGGLENLYGNTVQLPRKSDENGYVSIEIYDKTAGEDEDRDALPPELLKRIADRIDTLLERGYMQREIAILTNKKATATQLIAYLTDHNLERRGLPPLEFVSEDSLTLGSSKAVGIIVNCLQMIQNGMEGKFSETGETSRSSRINWLDVAAHFRYFSLRHPELPLQQRIETFLNEDLDQSLMSALLADMQAVTLPSLVEAIAETFVPDDLRHEQALYLAAFQDAVIDYCDIYPADIASFLRWWKATGSGMSVISPEGTDAISVMTIHKSKGLEFQCVILPDFDFSLKLKKEWAWVELPSDFPMAERMPKMMPIQLSDTKDDAAFFSNSPFARIYEDAVYFNRADQLNKAYVAMTRPISELYIYIPQKPEKKTPALDSMGECLREIIGKFEEHLADVAEDEHEMVIDPREMNVAENLFTYGQPIENVAESLAKYRETKMNADEEYSIDEYFVNSDRPLLQYQEEGRPKFEDPAEDDRSDPRSEGSMLHAVLEHVDTADDLRRAFEKVRVRGMITRDEIEFYYPVLKDALDSVADRGWFDGSKRVMTERALLKRGEVMKRPDRVLVDSDGAMTVIDYKFGTTNKSAYRRQVRGYMNRLKAYGKAPMVEGYLWYVKEGVIEKVGE